MTFLLRMEGVTLRRGGRVLLEDFDLDLAPGEALHLAGPNGSGKSSLIRLAAGLLRAERGRVERAQAALADDGAALDRELPLIAALDFWLGADGDRHRLAAAMTALDLAALAPVPVRLLSAGQVKRATLARVAASGAPLWLLDEPTNGLDPAGVRWLRTMLRAFADEGRTVLVSSHLLSEVQQTVDHVVIVDHGRHVTSGRVDELLAAHGRAGDTLEDVFLRLTTHHDPEVVR